MEIKGLVLTNMKIWMLRLTWTKYKNNANRSFSFSYVQRCHLGTQHFEKEIKCDSLTSAPASSSLQILFILKGVKIFHIIIELHFIIL